MAKITYLLGAGASYYACPVLENQAEMMVKIAWTRLKDILNELEINFGNPIYPMFITKENECTPNNNKSEILWYIGYFGKKAQEYNTIDTYAKKLYLNNEIDELNLLKMAVSVFFDLWENFEYKMQDLEKDTEPISTNVFRSSKKQFNRIDNRYKSLFSVLLDNDEKGNLTFNEDFTFISWNYDLQLEETFKLFLKDGFQKNYNDINKTFKFKQSQDASITNHVYHLNGHRGYYDDLKSDYENDLSMKVYENEEEYWETNANLYEKIITKKGNFNNYIKYAWEQDLENTFFKKIKKVFNETEVLVIIGYSFPAFNRKIDQELFKNLNQSKIKKIIYQDPNASQQMIENLFEKRLYKASEKIEIIFNDKELKQFIIPNEFFITQKSNNAYATSMLIPK